MMTFGSLFSGIGGFDLGLTRAGMACVWQVEKDPFCQQVLTKHAPAYWPNAQLFGDVRDVNKNCLDTVDLICGGFPCQPYSNAGLQRGAADDRDLWPEMLRIIKELQPRWVVGENVTGFIKLHLDQAMANLEGAGYESWAVVLPALAFNACHRRNRVFILANFTDPNGQRQRQPTVSRQSQESQFLRFSQLHQYLASPTDPNGNGLTPANHRQGESLSDQVGQSQAQKQRWPKQQSWISEPSEWQVEPTICGSHDGLSSGLDRYWGKRIAALGNAVVPQIVEHIGRCIIEVESNGQN